MGFRLVYWKYRIPVNNIHLRSLLLYTGSARKIHLSETPVNKDIHRLIEIHLSLLTPTSLNEYLLSLRVPLQAPPPRAQHPQKALLFPKLFSVPHYTRWPQGNPCHYLNQSGCALPGPSRPHLDQLPARWQDDAPPVRRYYHHQLYILKWVSNRLFLASPCAQRPTPPSSPRPQRA